ncbi:MAG: hypothetical protein WC269_01160 [Candidatus Gracilibacteria bacterium]|jgi:hypothetical protein
MKNRAIIHFVTINNKKYSYKFQKIDNKKTFMECEDANIGQEFLNEDIPSLLIDLPNLILAEKEYRTKQNEVIRFRISTEDKKLIENIAIKKGYSSVSGFLRDLALNKI